MLRVLFAFALVGCATNAPDDEGAIDPPAAGCAESFELRSLEGGDITERYRLGSAAFCLRLDTTNSLNPPSFNAHTELTVAETSPVSIVLTQLDGTELATSMDFRGLSDDSKVMAMLSVAWPKGTVTDVLVTATAHAGSATTPLYFKLDEFLE